MPWLTTRRQVDPQYYLSLSQQFQPRLEWLGPTLLVIDPGSGKEKDPGEGTGWSAWSIDKEIDQPVTCGCIHRVLHDWQEQVFLVQYSLKQIRQKLNARVVAVEQPMFFSAGRGLVAAKSGSLVKLSMLVGSILTVDPAVLLVPVTSWKGNRDKTATLVQVEAELGTKTMKKLLGNNRDKWNHNVIDSLGIGLWLKKNLRLVTDTEVVCSPG